MTAHEQTRSQQSQCPNCGAARRGDYCHTCGQRYLESEQRRFSALLGEWWAALTMWDSRLLRTFRLLFCKPGALTRAYIEGQRARYATPISLFLIANLLYFIAPPLSDFSPSLYEQVELQPYAALARQLVDLKLHWSQLSYEQFEALYNQQTKNLAKALIIINVPVFALFLRLIFIRRDMLYVDHFVFALHFFTVLLFVMIITSTAGAWLLKTIVSLAGGEASFQILFSAASLTGIVLIGSYVLFAWRRVYETRWVLAAAAVPLSLVLFVIVNQVNRFCLFLATLVAT